MVSLLTMLCGIAFAEGEGDGGGSSGEPGLSAPPSAPGGPELVGKRTATSETFDLPGEKLETRIYQTPIHYRTPEGDWESIEEDLQPGPGSAVTNGENRFDLQLPADLDSGPVRLRKGDQWVSVQLVGPATQSVAVEENTASYEAPAADTTFSFFSLPNGLKEDIVLEGPSAPHSFTYALDASAGVAPSPQEDGSIEFRDAEDDVVAVLPPPMMYDSSPDLPAMSEDVEYELAQQGDGWSLEVKADPAWLEDPERSWPVRIDPTLLTSVIPGDCIFSSYHPYEAHCGWAGWQILAAWAWYDSTLGELGRTAIGFDLSSIPKGAQVTSATVGLHAPSSAQNTVGVELRPMTEAANPLTASWNCRMQVSGNCTPWSTPGGALGSLGAQILTSERGAQAGWWRFHQGMAQTVQSWIDNGNLGMIVKLKDEADRICGESLCGGRMIAWNSSAVADASKRPYISVTYWLPAPTTSNPAPATSKLTSPSEGTRTGRRIKLRSAWHDFSKTTGVTYQWKPSYFATPGANQWQTIPANLVKDADGNAVSWPLAVEGTHSAPTLYFDAAAASDQAEREGETIQVRALFEGEKDESGGQGEPGPGDPNGHSEPVSVVVDPAKGNVKDATVAVGPGSLDLLTGNFKLAATDVSIPGPGGALEFSRSISSREDTEYSLLGGGKPFTVLGGGWQPSVPVEQAGGAAWRSARDVVEEGEEEGETISYTVVTDLEGGELPFEWNGSAFVTPEEAAGWVLSRQSSTQITLRDPSGGSTVFSKGSGSEYLPVSVSTLGGSGNKTQLTYELVGGNRRLTSVIAPTAPGVTCNPGSAHGETGCRVLTFHYQPATYWGAGSWYGDRLWAINYWGPAPGHEDIWTVAQYEYNSMGRLKAVWDPRVSPALKTEYTYATEGLGPVATIKPPGQEPWEMKYRELWETVENPAVPGWFDFLRRKGWWRLEQVKRKSLLASPNDYAVTTVAYDVPVSGSGAPYDLSAGTIAQWGQEDIPTDATAIFPPDEVPSSSPPSAYTRATLYYMDAEGQLVNTATPSGAGTSAASISTTETDEHGNVTRELTPQNRLRALAFGSLIDEKAGKARELDTHRTFNAEGTEMLEEWGPMHDVRLESGSTVKARFLKKVEYDQAVTSHPEAPTPPSGTPMPHLPTREITGASIHGEGIDADQKVTGTAYNWDLRQPIETIVDPEGLNIRTRTVYDATSGAPTEIRQPKASGSADAGTTQITYYSSSTSTPNRPECSSRSDLAGLPCVRTLGNQPSGGPEVPETFFAAYNALGQPTEIVERAGSGLTPLTTLRTTKIEYDAAGRPTAKWQEGGGVALPRTGTTYYSSTGLPEKTRFFCPSGNSACEAAYKGEYATTATYDGLGRPTTYEDGDGNVSTVTYDLLGRPVSTDDDKGAQTLKYDSVTGLLTELEDSDAGTFTAAYDADGNLTERGLPNGLTAETTYEPTGAPSDLTYTKASSCGTSCTWLDFSTERSIHGQILAQTSNLSSQQYSYDKAGRLTETKDTPQGGSCTTRSYSFDANSNRTALTTRSPGIGGACASSGGTTQNYSYDAADRLIGSGVVYDDLGRITELASAYSGGGTLKTSYFSNEMLAQQEQDGVVNKYLLDSTGRQRFRESSEGGGKLEAFHYSGPGDAVAWSQTGPADFSRYVGGIGGELGAIASTTASTSTVELALVNLHGDVIATADPNPSATSLLTTSEYDEYGNPKQSGMARFGWVGGKARRTELKSGVIQMGVRSYVPALGRFLTPDPVFGGSANAYEYAAGDPVNNFDLTGEKCVGSGEWVAQCKRMKNRAAKKRMRQARRESRENNIQNAVIKTRTCTAIACNVEWGGGGSGRDPVGDFIAGVANDVVHYLYNNPAATQADVVGFIKAIYAGVSSPAGRRATACAKDATTGWQEVAALRGIPLGGLAAGLYTATKCVVGGLAG